MRFAITILILLCQISLGAQALPQQDGPDVVRSRVRYVIYRNKFTPRLNEKDEDARTVFILMDPKSFSKNNLTTLFSLVAKRYPSPSLLTVFLVTVFEDVETPEEEDLGGSSETSIPHFSTDRAVFVRANKKSFFNLYLENGGFEKVEMK